MRHWPGASTGGAIGLLSATPAQAHAFGARYDLPLPLEHYLLGAGAAVLLSFVVMVLVFPARLGQRNGPALDLRRLAFSSALGHPITRNLLQVLSVALFLLIVCAGFLGSQDTVENIAPAFVWIVWWVGLAYCAALVCDLWPAVNPWSVLYGWLEKLLRLLGLRTDMGLAYPAWLGLWPAVLLFGAFAWLELISETARLPATLASLVLIYSLITWAGMALFGRQSWLAGGEAFTQAFGIFGRFAPLSLRPSTLRPYGAGLVVTEPCRFSLTVFILLMLSTVTFDGLKETPLWSEVLSWLLSRPSFGAATRSIHDIGFDVQMVWETLILAGFPIAFLAVFLLFCGLGVKAAGSKRSVIEIAGLFVLSLVPIAIAYHLAHYLSYLLIAGQYIIPLISDPFGFGWDLFGTADYRINIAVIGAKSLWRIALTTIVVGHVFSVAIAHLVALRVFETARAALFSQLPFLVLMVAYTVLSLWILSQPIVESPNLSTLRAPAGKTTLAPFEFREICLEPGRGGRFDYSFRSDQPVDFDIHYHEGLAVRFPIKMEAVIEETARFDAPDRRLYCFLWFNEGLAPANLTYRILRRSTNRLSE